MQFLEQTPAAPGHADPRRRGVSLVMVTVLIPVVLGLAVLAYDLGVVMLGHARLQSAVDAATLDGVRSLGDGHQATYDRVTSYLLDEVDRAGITLTDRQLAAIECDVQEGYWDSDTRTFAPRPWWGRPAEALRVRVRLPGDVPVAGAQVFAPLLGARASYAAEAVARLGSPRIVDVDVRSSLYLAGTPEGTELPYTYFTNWQPPADHVLRHRTVASTNGTYRSLAEAPDEPYQLLGLPPHPGGPADPSLATMTWDASGDDEQCRPMAVDIPITPGLPLTFTNHRGKSGDYHSTFGHSFEGSIYKPVTQPATNGFATTTAPLNAVMGVFLGDEPAAGGPMPPAADYTTPASRARHRVEPKLGEMFFIGDGVDNATGTVQRFVPPEGATRLFLGVHDEFGFWWDNFGTIRLEVAGTQAVLVR